MTPRRKAVALMACIASMALVLPSGLAASAQEQAPSGRASAYAVFTMKDFHHAVGRWDPCTPIGYRVNRRQAAPELSRT